MKHTRRWFALAALFLGLVLTPQVAASEQAITGDVPSGGGIAIVQWGGGTMDELEVAASDGGCDLVSVWLAVAGDFVGYIVGAPNYVNATWSSSAGTDVPSATPILIACAVPPLEGIDSCEPLNVMVWDHSAEGSGKPTSREALDAGVDGMPDLAEGTFVETVVSDSRVRWDLVTSEGAVAGSFIVEGGDASGWRLISGEWCSVS